MQRSDRRRPWRRLAVRRASRRRHGLPLESVPGPSPAPLPPLEPPDDDREFAEES